MAADEKMTKKIKQRWEESAEGYYSGIIKELEGEKKQAWKSFIKKYLPENRRLNVLDIGTGPGFFPVIFGEEGHTVTGIDLSENMLEFANKNAHDNGIEATFIRMDCSKLNFKEEAFDLIICRNLTWILQEPERTYKEWLRVLKSGGKIMIFDANWNRYLFDEDIRKKHDSNLEKVRQKFGFASHDHLDQEEMESEGRALPMGRYNRPAWDLNVFINNGCKEVFAYTDISDHIPFSEKELMEYEDVATQFLVGAVK